MAEQGIIPQLLSLDFGLDLTTPKPSAAPGSLLSCLNYERGDMDGLSRINGYEPYDGSTPPDTSSFKLIDLESPHSLSIGDDIGVVEIYVGQLSVVPTRMLHAAAEVLAAEKGGDPVATVANMLHESPTYGILDGDTINRTVHIGTVVEVITTTRIMVAVLNEDSLVVGVDLLKLDVEGGNHSAISKVSAVTNLNDIVYDVLSNYQYRTRYATELREEIEDIPGPSAVVWFKDALYAVGINTSVVAAEIGTLYRARTVQQLLDDSSGADPILGWEQLNIGYSEQQLSVGLVNAVNSLPTARALELEQSQYEFIVANYYASERTTSLYGVSGASRAFTYDGNTFKFIDTGIGQELDKPRHLAKFRDRLWLGYSNGSIVGSVVGNPLSFEGIDGAVEIAFGDRIVGLQPLAGEALGVFCENSVWYLDKDLAPHLISGNTGCIEYTLAATDRPYYCSAAGIMTIEANDKYGEFSGVSLSDKVNPWLRPRLKRTQGKFFSHPSVIGNMIVRTKNQYRLFFRDGYVLTMAMTERGPVFTTQKYTVTEQGSGEDFEPRIDTFTTFASTSQMSQDGTERLFAIHRNTRAPFTYNKIVEMDVGWSFAGDPIQHFFETNASPNNNPFLSSKLAYIRVYGLSKGTASLKIQTSGTNDGFTDTFNIVQEQNLSLPRQDALYDDDFTSTTDVVDLADRGYGFKLKISNRELLIPEPQHACQLITLLHKPGEKLDV